MLEQNIKNLPKTPGVYQFFDKNGTLLYVGKAKVLSNRVKSYFRFTPTLTPASNLNLRIANMINQVVSINYLTVTTEHDALILENSLIKQLKPKYNILLRDDKTYPYLYIDYDDTFPRIDITRKVLKNKNIKYFGPYSSGARDLLDALYLLFPLVQKKGCLKGKKACLFHQIKRCLAPCEDKISQSEYKALLDNATYFIHNPKSINELLKDKMNEYAQSLNFEQAAQIRDMIEKIKTIEPKSGIDFVRLENFDLLAVLTEKRYACGIRFFVRDGKIVSSSHFINQSNNGFDIQSLYKQMILSHYKAQTPININTIYTAHQLDDSEGLENALNKRFNKKLHVKHPHRGDKAKLCKLALQNAQEIILKQQNSSSQKIQKDIYEYFRLSSYPQEIEVFDNSHLGGEANVGAFVCWRDDEFLKSNYRHFHLKNKDEYSQMREMLTNRVERFEKLSPPDLWLIDGGKTLFELANDIIKSSGANVDILAISKEKIDAKSHRAKGKAKDIIHSKDGSFTLPTTDKKLQFLQRLRDEAHRFAISFHRKTKLKLDKENSRLKKLGLSEAKIKKMILFYGSFSNIENANFDELVSIVGQKDAKKIKAK